MNLPAFLNTGDWATWQELVFAGRIQPTRWSLGTFWFLCFFQELFGPSNLTIRQNIIRASMWHGRGFGPKYLARVRRQFDALVRHGYWLESRGYFQYVTAGLDWYEETHDQHLVPAATVAAIFLNYYRLPTVLPEVSEPAELALTSDTVDDAAFFCKTWKNPSGSTVLAQVVVCKDMAAGPRLNFHHHPGGCIGIYIHGQGWVKKIEPYAGFKLLAGITSAQLRASLPAGALRPWWRLMPMRDECDRVGNSFGFRWKSNLWNRRTTAFRVLSWTDTSIKLVESGAEPIIWNF